MKVKLFYLEADDLADVEVLVQSLQQFMATPASTGMHKAERDAVSEPQDDPQATPQLNIDIDGATTAALVASEHLSPEESGQPGETELTEATPQPSPKASAEGRRTMPASRSRKTCPP